VSSCIYDEQYFLFAGYAIGKPGKAPMSDEMNAPSLRNADFKTTLRYMRKLKREMDAAQASRMPPIEELDTRATQGHPAVDDRVLKAVMKQCREGNLAADNATEFAMYRSPTKRGI